MVEEGKKGRQDFQVGSLNVTHPIKSIIFLVHQNKENSRVDVYVNCNNQGVIPIRKTLRDVFNEGTDSVFRVVFTIYYLLIRLQVHPRDLNNYLPHSIIF